MMKRSLVWLVIVSCSSSLMAFPRSNCSRALPDNDQGFCESFKSSAECHCEESMPGFMCHNMDLLYRLMIGRYGSVQKACESQQEAPAQECIDGWNCYRMGGRDSLGRLCSGTGEVCK